MRGAPRDTGKTDRRWTTVRETERATDSANIVIWQLPVLNSAHVITARRRWPLCAYTRWPLYIYCIERLECVVVRTREEALLIACDLDVPRYIASLMGAGISDGH